MTQGQMAGTIVVTMGFIAAFLAKWYVRRYEEQQRQQKLKETQATTPTQTKS